MRHEIYVHIGVHKILWNKTQGEKNMAVSDSWLRAVYGKPQYKMVTKSDREGLSVRVTPKGKVIFQYRYR